MSLEEAAMKGNVFPVLVGVLGAVIAVGPDAWTQGSPSIELPSHSTPQAELTELRRVAETQRTNAVAWLDYGTAALRQVLERMPSTGGLPSTNDYDEALFALSEALRVDPENYKTHRELAHVYELRARRKPSEDDPTKYLDLEKALSHFSMALSNAPSPGERRRLEQRISNVMQRMRSERKASQELEIFKREQAEEHLLPPRERQKLIEDRQKNIDEAAKQVFASDKGLQRLNDLKRRYQQEPLNPRTLVEYADSLIRVEYQGLGNTNALLEAQTLLEKAVELDQHNGHAFASLGLCVDLQGKEALALPYYKKAIEENDTSQFIRDRIEMIERRTRSNGNADEAR